MHNVALQAKYELEVRFCQVGGFLWLERISNHRSRLRPDVLVHSIMPLDRRLKPALGGLEM